MDDPGEKLKNKTMTPRRIEYRFLHWGPFVCQYKLEDDEIKKLKALNEGKDYRDNLAGHINHEKSLDRKKVFEIVSPYWQSYLTGYHEFRKKVLAQGVKLTACWINHQKKYEFNPPHTHDEDLSFVIYTEIPDGLEDECMNYFSNSPGPGSISFDFNMPNANNKFYLQTHSHLPSVGDMFVFPAGLPHWVYPFRTTEGERVSISGNLRLIYDSKKEKALQQVQGS